MGAFQEARRAKQDQGTAAPARDPQPAARARGGDGYDAQVAALAPAAQPGYEEHAAQLAPGGATRDAQLRRKADQLFTIMQAAWTDCATATQAWVAQAEAMGRCYFDAWQRHEAVRRRQEAIDKLQADACFAVLQLATGGALASLSSLVKRPTLLADAPEWQVAGISSVIQGALGKTVDGIAQPKSSSHSVSGHPLEFRDKLTAAVSQHAKDSLDHLNGWVQLAKDIRIGREPLSLVEYVDPVRLDADIQAWKGSKEIFRVPQAVDVESVTRELETGLWARWVQALTSLQQIQGKYTSRTVRHYISPGGLIEERLTELTGRDFDSGWYTSDDEVKALIRWGRGWKPSTRYSI